MNATKNKQWRIKSSKAFRQESSSNLSHQSVCDTCSTCMQACKFKQVDVVLPEQEG